VIPLIATLRDMRDFLAAKKRKREPLRWDAKGVGVAIYTPRHPQGFANFRAALRGEGHWGQASEGLDRLETALRKRHQIGLPMPRKVMQNEDRSLSVWWGGDEHLMVRAFPDRFFALIGGAKGIPSPKITTDLLDALALQSRIQNAS
jgi:hypothetical protein